MTGAVRWTLLLLYLLQSAPGRSCLAPPQNVTLLSKNFSVYLTWLPGPDHLQNVTYVVAYQSSVPPRRWQKVKKCAGTKELSCSLMCLEKQDLYNKFKGRVRAVSASARSPWVESEYLEYLFQVEPAPPDLVFTPTEEVLSVNATYQLPPCMPPVDLKYEVDFWKEGIMNKTRFPVTLRGQLVQIPLQPATKGQHCLSARTIYTFGDTKYSEFSKPTCFLLEPPSVNWAFLVPFPLLLPLLLVIVMGRMLWKNFTGDPWFQQAKKPQALDFSGRRHPPATFQPSGPEPLNNLTLCPQKELTRKVKLTPRARAPATSQAESEKDSATEDKDDDEEDMDDSVSVQPYMEHPHFLEQERQTPGPSEAGVPLEGSSAWDSSYRSWTSSAGSSPWDEAGSSGYLAEKGPGHGLDVDGCQEALSLLKFSENSGSLHEPLKDDLSSRATWRSLSPKLSLVPGDPPVSLHTLTFCWDSSLEEEEEEEEEEGEGERESEIADGGSSSWAADSLQRTEAKGRTLGCYMAR